MRSHLLTGTIILLTALTLLGCPKSNVVTPPPESNLMRINVTRLYPDEPVIDAVRITITRTSDGTVVMPGRKIELTASTGNISLVTDRGNGDYEAVWTGSSTGEVAVIARDLDSDPPVESSLTFLAMAYLETAWDIPVKLASPVSTDGWDTAPFLYPDGNHLAFAYITLDLAALSAGVSRPIGQERPGQVTPQTLNIYLADHPENVLSRWTGWTVEDAQCNLFQATPTSLAAPSITSNGQSAFCTVQEFDGTSYTPASIYAVDAEFSTAPVPLGPPVDIEGFGEDNPYLDITHGWLYFDTYDLSDPLSKQDIRAARSLGGGVFDAPLLISGNLNTADVETQPFVYEPTSTLYFASDRQQEEFQLAIWRIPICADQANGMAELVAKGMLAVGKPSISYDGKWLCFAYARAESGGANADIAMAHLVE